MGEEPAEPPLELSARIDQMMRRGGKVDRPRDAVRHARERQLDAADVAVSDQPLLIAHPRVDVAQTLRQFVEVRVERGVRAGDERLERLPAVLVEMAGEEMVEENVGDDARVVAMFGDQDAAE